MKTYNAAPISTTKYLLGESPFYDERNGLCSFVDIKAGKFYTFPGKDKPDTDNIRCIDFGEQIGAAVPTLDGKGYAVAGTKSLFLYKEKEIVAARDLTGIYEPFQRSNDAKADPKGCLWFGSSCLEDEHEPSGNLYRLDKTGIKVMQENTKISNGMAWSADRKHFFFSDSPYKQIFVYDYDEQTGDISGRRVLFEIEDGVPDGMCIDRNDNLWVAVWGGSRIEKRSTKTGELLGVVKVAAEHTTSCCFYGKDMDKLFITSSGDGLTGEFDGCIFTCDVDEKGCETDFVDM